MNGQRAEGDYHFNTAGFILSRMNLEEQNEISTSFKKYTKVELLFHFFPFFFQFFPSFSGKRECEPIRARKISSFSRD